MNRYKITVILCSIGIALCLITMTLSTYAYFTVDIRGEGEDIDVRTFNDDATIVFTDTSNVSMVNGYTGDSIIKKFTIENTSDYVLHYDIILKNVINNFSNPEELVYTLYSTDGGYRNTSMVPTDDSVIASNILVKPGKKHEYTFQVTFLDTNTNQNDNMNKTFSSNIDIVPSNINIVKNNIYSISDDDPEITFLKIEKIRNNLDIKDNDINRIKYSILFYKCFSITVAMIYFY